MSGRDIHIGQIKVPAESLEFSYIRASGPGGQNVNKVSTAAQLRFDAENCPSIDKYTFNRLRQIAGSRMTQDGVIVITAQRFRSQERNREDAIDRLTGMLRDAAHRQKARKPTRISKGVKKRRLDSKRRHSNIKKNRGRVRGDE
ncbi:MAG: aminoacyl-tRNA hydrolase [Rhodospirillaceae bacterium]|nr:aminoacyl-tRNA hydrolase [Rhodospirillaceae bacterium]|tara:strand:+ start:4243 stop:4674 length:432 start_codon:yes stop_codon:yes gene_type:complete